MQRLPPPYPPPITTPEQRRAAQELQLKRRELSSPLMVTRFPLDGALGYAFLAFLVGVWVFGNAKMLMARGLPTEAADVYPAVTGNTLFLGLIAWVAYISRGQRRVRRALRGQCAECGTSLDGVTAATCPGCGAPAARISDQA